jgi:hypothetical protein
MTVSSPAARPVIRPVIGLMDALGFVVFHVPPGAVLVKVAVSPQAQTEDGPVIIPGIRAGKMFTE